MIKTTNLLLQPYGRRHVVSLLRSKAELGALLGVAVADGWPHFPEAFTDTGGPDDAISSQWSPLFFIHLGEATLVGSGGFKGGPDAAGDVEIGYEIAASQWNRGYATEAVGGMIDYAFAQPDVRSVSAHTLGANNASNTVLKKVGMGFVTEIADPDDGTIWLWRRVRGL